MREGDASIVEGIQDTQQRFTFARLELVYIFVWLSLFLSPYPFVDHQIFLSLFRLFAALLTFTTATRSNTTPAATLKHLYLHTERGCVLFLLYIFMYLSLLFAPHSLVLLPRCANTLLPQDSMQLPLFFFFLFFFLSFIALFFFYLPAYFLRSFLYFFISLFLSFFIFSVCRSATHQCESETGAQTISCVCIYTSLQRIKWRRCRKTLYIYNKYKYINYIICIYLLYVFSLPILVRSCHLYCNYTRSLCLFYSIFVILFY